jgi:Rhs element Vgr protein
MPASSPESTESDLITFTLKANGKDMTDLHEVASIVVSTAVNRIPLARIVLLDGSTPEEAFTASESDDFAPGSLIEIAAGYHSQNTPIFTGLIVKHGLRQRSGGPSQLVLECRAQSIKMTAVRRNAEHGTAGSTLTDSALMETLIQTYGLTAKVAATTPALPWLTQFDCTEWDFLVIRAQINGMLVLADGSNIRVAVPDFSQAPALSVTYGKDILELQTEIDASTQWSGVQCSAWDPTQQAMASATASPTGVNAWGNDTTRSLAEVLMGGMVSLASSTPLPDDQLKSWASAVMLKSELAKITGRITFQGSSSIAPGGLLQIEGLGKRFNGRGFVGAVTHRIENGQWTTEAAMGVDPAWFAARPDVSGPPVGAQIPPVRGLQIGVVKKIDADPAGERRVQVAVPVVAAAPALMWARLGSFYAGRDSGAVFYPEIEDEVVLGFLDNDPRYPIILSSLSSSAQKGSIKNLEPDAENSTKAIVTHGQLRVVFDDKNKVLTLQTPNGNKLVLSDKDNSVLLQDQSGNAITLSSSGIELKSTSDVNVTAAQKLTETGTQGVTVSGMNIALKADTEFTAKGNASATLQATGTTTIKGAMVMIN